jgi:tetratricopeptide (TPR) repeat protein
MGRVYLAEALEPCAVPEGNRVALKVVHPHLLTESGFFKRFLREAEIGKAVAHPNVVRCYDIDQLVVDGTTHAFLVMEYVEGQTLRDLLDELGSVPEELCRHIGREVSKGLSAIHEAGVVHRDLKPENVLITPTHEIKVMDLGVARLADQAIRLSQSGAFVGSFFYASPEHFKCDGDALDGRADLFSLGVILYELSCGAHPHPGDDCASVLSKVVHENPRRLGERNPQLSAFFEEVVHALLAKERKYRFASGSKLLQVLEQGEKSTWWGQRARTVRAETKRPLRRIRIPRETAVYGREKELERLEALLRSAKSGDGRVVVIEGEAGIGKTRLVDELIGRLHQDGEDLNFLFGSYPPGGAATAAGAWSTAYREQFGAEGLEETLKGYLTVTPVLIPAFAALLRGEPPPEGTEPLTKDSIQTAVVHATRALAAERTTVVLIEDLHFAPEEGRAMFASLALAVPEHRILLVGTARPGLSESWRANLERLSQANRLELSRLGPKDLAALLEDSFQSRQLADELGMQIARKSDGNPFFVFEIIRGLREGQFIKSRPDGTWVSTQVIQDIRIPSSVQDLVQARIADLTEEEQELLDVAACCGFEFDPNLVAQALGIARIPALRRFAHLQKSHQLVRSVGDRFAFDHHQVQEALYAALPSALAKEYHAAVGDALEVLDPEPDGATAVDLCEHFLEGRRGADALRHLDAALDHLASGYLNEQVVAVAERALGLEGLLSGPDRAEVLLRAAIPLGRLGRRGREEAALEEAVALAEEAGEPGLRVRAHQAMGGCYFGQARYEPSREEFRIARALAGEAGDRRGEARNTGNLGLVSNSLGRYEEAREYFEHAIENAREIGDRRNEARNMGNLGLVLLYLGHHEEAREQLEKNLAIADESGNRAGEEVATGNLGMVHASVGRYEAARESFERSLAIAREIGHRGGEGRATGNLGVMSECLGRYKSAREHNEHGLMISREIGNRLTEGISLVNLGTLHAWLGDFERANEELDGSLAILREIGARREEGYALHGRVVVAELTGDIERARRISEQAIALRREIDYRDGLAKTLVVLGRLGLIEDRHDEARNCFTEALAIGEELDASDTIVLAAALLALLPGEVSDAAVETFNEQEARLPHAVKMQARFLLYKTTTDPVHLSEAHRLLCHLRDHAPEEYRETMIEKVPLHRDIAAEWGKNPTAC